MTRRVLCVLLAVAAASTQLSPQSALVSPNSHQHPAPGTSLIRFEKIDDGIYKGSEPKTDADYRFLQSLGVKYVLELKFLPVLPRFERRKAKRYGMTLIPVTVNASPFAPSEKHVNRAVCALRDRRLHPIYLHCDIGRDRTSLVATLYEMYFRNLPPEDAWVEMKRFGFKDSWQLAGLRGYLRKRIKAYEQTQAVPDCPDAPDGSTSHPVTRSAGSRSDPAVRHELPATSR